MTRDTRWDRARALRDHLWSADASDDSGRALTDVVLERFRSDTKRFSDVLEWSLCEDEHGIDAERFSYAFPDYTRARDEIERTLLAWTHLLGDAAERAARGVAKAARQRAVEQLLIGYARGTSGVHRAKLYLQFRDDAGPAALALARAITGTRQTTRSDAYPLHLLGLDIGTGGLAGAKLYFVERADKQWFPAWQRSFRNVLRIHRLGAPDDPGFEEPSEIDFSLQENALDWDELMASPVARPFARARTRFDEIGRAFKIRPRRVSFALGDAHKLNVYYVLDESEPPPSETKPSGGG